MKASDELDEMDDGTTSFNENGEPKKKKGKDRSRRRSTWSEEEKQA